VEGVRGSAGCCERGGEGEGAALVGGSTRE
jgi:hypothetical protein